MRRTMQKGSMNLMTGSTLDTHGSVWWLLADITALRTRDHAWAGVGVTLVKLGALAEAAMGDVRLRVLVDTGAVARKEEEVRRRLESKLTLPVRPFAGAGAGMVIAFRMGQPWDSVSTDATIARAHFSRLAGAFTAQYVHTSSRKAAVARSDMRLSQG